MFRLFSPIWKERFRRQAKRHAIIMIMSTMETMTADREAATINSRFKEKDLMTIEYRQAGKEDAELLVNIYNASFYDDYLRYGSCPGYGNTKEMMEESITRHPKHILLCDKKPVGCISYTNLGRGEYEVACLCIVPDFQGKGIGTQAIRFLKTFLEDWEKLTLVTPIDKKQNVKFYTEKCGFHIESTEKDGSVELARFVLIRTGC